MLAQRVPAQSVETILRIGENANAIEYTFGAIADAAFGPRGEVYVLDGMNGVVRVYDEAGKHLHAFGRNGSGPGEFGVPVRLVLTPAEVWVTDALHRRTAKFAHNGEHLETILYPAPVRTYDLVIPLRHGMYVAGNANSVAGLGLERFGSAPSAQVQRIAASFRQRSARTYVVLHSSGVVDTVSQLDHGALMYATEAGYGMAGHPWGAPHTFAFSGDSLIALIDPYHGHVRVLSSTNTGLRETKRGRLTLQPMPLTEVDWQAAAADATGVRRVPPGARLTGPPFAPLLGGPLFDDQGALWVARLSGLRSDRLTTRLHRYIVVPSDNRQQYTVDLPADFGLLAVRQDLLLGVRRGLLDTQHVEVLRLLR